MEELENFGADDLQNGILDKMFRNAGIDDVNAYMNDVRDENIDYNDESIYMNDDDDDFNSANNSNIPMVQSRGFGAFHSPQATLDKRNKSKGDLNNVKNMYKLYKSLDKNGDGKITVEDVEIILKQMGLGFVSKYLARTLFNIVDANHDGKLDFRDLVVLASLLKRLSASSSSPPPVTSVRF